MSARDDYPKMTKIVGQSGGGELGAALDEIDRLRAENEQLRNGDEAWRQVLPKIAAAQADCEAFRRTIPCPTCGGRRWHRHEGVSDEGIVGDHVDPCPACTDGYISHARAWAIVAAVFSQVVTDYHGTDVDELVRHLRTVRP